MRPSQNGRNRGLFFDWGHAWGSNEIEDGRWVYGRIDHAWKKEKMKFEYNVGMPVLLELVETMIHWVDSSNLAAIFLTVFEALAIQNNIGYISTNKIVNIK